MDFAQKAAGLGGQAAKKAMPSELIYVVELDENLSDYEIDLGTEQGTTRIPIEKRLAFRDNFVISGAAVGVLSQTLDADGNPMWGTDFPQFWEDPNVFTTAATGPAVVSESKAVAGVWNGHLTFQGNEEMKIVRMPLRGFRTILTTQRSTQVTGFSGTTSTFNTHNMQDGSELKSLGGIVKVGGGNENKLVIHIECKDKTHLEGTSTRKNYLFIVLRGAFIKGGTIAELQKN